MLEGFEVLRVAPVTRFEAYRKEIANTEALLHQLPTPPTGDDLERLLVQQSKEREAFERYQQVRQQYVPSGFGSDVQQGSLRTLMNATALRTRPYNMRGYDC